MNDVYLDHLAYALGERRCSVDETVAAGRASSTPSALREAGFVNHHVCAEQTTAYDLAKRTIETMGADLGRVGAIIYATCLPLNASIGSEQRFRETHDVKHLMDFPASHLQADFGLDGALVIGLSQQACTGMLGSLRLARALLHAELHSNRWCRGPRKRRSRHSKKKKSVRGAARFSQDRCSRDWACDVNEFPRKDKTR